MNNADMPAMPHTEYGADGNMPKGVTKREYFAGLAMQGIAASYVNMNMTEKQIARWAVLQADALLAELEADRSELARHQPCGCVICVCEDDEQCQGCGAKSCGKHPAGEIPNPVHENAEADHA